MQPVSETPIKIAAKDGFVLSGMLFEEESHQEALIIGSAFGVPHTYYHHFARYMAQQGLSVVVFDYRGINSSREGVAAPKDMRMQDWGILDLEAVIQWTQRKNFQKIHYLGHSAGGQIVGLAPSSRAFDTVVLSASGVGAWRKWTGAMKWLLAFMWYAIFPVILKFQRGDFLHSKLLGSVPVPKTIVQQWLDWAQSKEYLFTAEHELELSAYHETKADVFGLTISDDWYAPATSRDALMGHFKSATKKKSLITPQDLGKKSIGHFGLFRNRPENQQKIWQPILEFIQREK